MTPVKKKWLIFVSVFAFWLVADLWTKHWADTSLANSGHPLVARVADGDVGKALKTFVAERYGFDGDEVLKAMPHVERLEAPIDIKSEAKIFADSDTIASSRGYWIFWRSDVDLPPRRLDRALELSRLEGWLRMANPAASREALVDTAKKSLADTDFGSWAADAFRKLNPEDITRLSAEQRIHPMPWAAAALNPEQPVAAGETYLLTHRQVDVSGEWFKYLYAENPGAAFGFMKGVEPDLRKMLFMLLSLVAFIVIISISHRLPPTSRLVLIAFAGILSGAVGNFIDRIRYGFVIDFIDMDLGFMQWPTYNIADIGISCGVVVLVLDLTFNKKSVLATPKTPKADAAKSQPA